MADVVFGSAKGAVDSLLGRLTTVLVDEAKLLGSVRGEVRFLKDEMESVNGFLLHLAKSTPPGTDDHDDQVRAWMGQVRDFAYSSETCIDMYIQDLGTGGRQGKGLLAYLWWLPQLVRTIPARHRIVTRIRGLKARALEIGERRKRYGVTVPLPVQAPSSTTQGLLRADQGRNDTTVEEEHMDSSRRRALLDDEDPDAAEAKKEDDAQQLISLLLKWKREGKSPLRVIPIVGPHSMGKTLADRVYEDSSVQDYFRIRARITVGKRYKQDQVIKDLADNLLVQRRKIIGQLSSVNDAEKFIEEHLRYESFLIVLDDVWQHGAWQAVRSVLPSSVATGSAFILTTRLMELASQCSPYAIFDMTDPTIRPNYRTVLEKAIALLGNNPTNNPTLKPLLESIISNRITDTISIRMFLGLLYSNPSWTEEHLKIFANSLDRLGEEEGMFLLCYNDLPYHYKTCLWYLSIFPPDQGIRRTSLIRRWVAENVVTKRDGLSALDEGERCFDELLTRGFLHAEFGVSDTVKICKIHPLLHEPIAKIAREEGTVDTSFMMPSWSYRLSIRKKIQQQQLSKKKDTYFSCLNSKSDHPLDDIISFLEILPSCSKLSLLKVLDLEGCQGLKEYHIKNICNTMLQLKYLSLRNTGTTKLPKEINKLQCLETLDIRQNKVSKFAAKSITLPLLKHLLAGSTGITTEDVIKSTQTFSTVHMPYGIGGMRNLQVLSQIEVSHSDDELQELGQLDQLKKLGVVIKLLKEKEGPNFKHLLQAVAKLNKCLRSLSLSIEGLTEDIEIPDLDMTADIFSPPKLLQSLHIRGFTSGLPIWIFELTRLTKVSLRETSLTQRAVRMLGSLASLSCLKLLYKSYMETRLSFESGEFKSLKFLVIEGSHITNIIFAPESATKLKMIVWSFTSMQSLSGTNQLPSLKYVELNRGQCDSEGLQRLRQEIYAHPKRIIFELNPPEDGQGSGEADAAN